MPIYEVTGPDGRVFRVTAPDGATEEQALAYAQANVPALESAPKDGPWTRYQQAGDGPWTRYAQQPVKPRADLAAIEKALRAADAAGNVEDARRLAQAYAQARDAQQASGRPRVQIKRVQFPDGSIKRVEVPEGATDEQILSFVQSQYQPQEAKQQYQRPQAGYTVDQLYAKLERADAAGDTEAAMVIADEIRRVQGAQPAKPDFSDVRGSSQTLQRQGKPGVYNGPLLAESKLARGGGPGPTIEAINAANRAAREAPGFAQEQARIFSENRRAHFKSLPAPLRFGIGLGGRVDAVRRGVGQAYAWARGSTRAGTDPIEPPDRR